ncbi:MAG TPA: hypothetical protein VMO26_18580 [Vicinamibacterales bacterium]|nr:hypothetical protein [Vicinamibacterales bacterium]
MQAMWWVASCAALALWATAIMAQRSDAFGASRDHVAIQYSSAAVSNAVTALNEKLERGQVSLTSEPVSGYLRSALGALAIPVESQVLVYSQTSFQARRISRANPRAVYFNDSVAVGWVRGGDLLEVAVQDPQQGAIFYTLAQTDGTPSFTRDDKCLSCHLSWETRAVPGLFVQTVFPRRSEDEYANGFTIDHRVPLAERWGGWYVTGDRVPPSMGNIELLQPAMPASGPALVAAKPSLAGVFDGDGYPTMFSDVTALMVLEHQVHATNLITRAGWEFRIGSPHVRQAVDELVDYLLFVDEAPLPHAVKGSSKFAEVFAAEGPRDSKGRSLRELDLTTRLMRYPLSYMIYSPGFHGLPKDVQSMTLARLHEVLSGKDTDTKYAHLTPAVRLAIQQILADTLPAA